MKQKNNDIYCSTGWCNIALATIWCHFQRLPGYKVFYRFTNLIFPLFIPIYEVFFNIHESDNSYIRLSGHRTLPWHSFDTSFSILLTAGVYVGTLNLIASIPGPSILNSSGTSDFYVHCLHFPQFFFWFLVCFINFQKYANSTIWKIGVKVKLICPWVTISHYQTNYCIPEHAIVGICIFCEYTLFCRFTLGVGVETMYIYIMQMCSLLRAI